jgi:hypothetical protein
MDRHLPLEQFKFLESFRNLLESLMQKLFNEKIKEKQVEKLIEEFSNFYLINLLPPFSIQNICNVAKFLGKQPGEWFSDVTLINIFSRLNKELFAGRSFFEIFYVIDLLRTFLID